MADTPAVKPGYKTTEFWFSLVVMIVGAVLASGVVAEGSLASQILGGVMAVLAQLGYAKSRADVKASVAPEVKPPELL